MPNSMWDELEAFVRAETEISKQKPLSRQLSLENDLDLTGDDADDFMGKFFEKFKVDHGDFEFDRYFSPEGFNPFSLLATVFSKKARAKYDKAQLTLGMLEKAIELGAWDSARITR
jgi:hypothetical protein